MTLPYAMRAELWHSGAWNDVSADVRIDSVQIKRGRNDEDASYRPGSAKLRLDNLDGTYSPRNPNSPLYGLIGRNTSVRIGLGRPAVGRAVAVSGVSTTSLVAPSITAETTGVQLLSYFATPSGTVTEPGGFTQDFEGTVGSWSRSWSYQDSVAAGATGDETATHSTSATAYAAINVHVPGGSWGSNANSTSAVGGNDVNFTVADVEGSLIVATCFWNSDPDDRMQPPRVDMPDQGLGWYLIADSGVSPDASTPRATAWAMRVPSTATGTWNFNFLGKRDGRTESAATCRVQTIDGADDYLPRFAGEVSEWPLDWNVAGTEASTPITVYGVGRRLGAVNAAAPNSVYTATLASTNRLLGYWPMNDGTGAQSFASAVPGVAPMQIVGAPALAAFTGFEPAGPLPTFTAAGAYSAPLVGAVADAAAFGSYVRIGEAGTTAGANLVAAGFTGGTLQAAVLEWVDASNVRIKFDYGSSEPTATLGLGASGNGLELTFIVTMVQDGADIDWAVSAAIVDPDTLTVAVLGSVTGTQASQTMGTIQSVYVGLETNTLNANHTNAPAFGHVWASDEGIPYRFVSGGDQLAPNSAQALLGWIGQKATDRIHRVVAGAGAKVLVQHNDVEQAMDVENPLAPLQALAACEATAVGGNLFDAAGFVGLRHRGRVAKANAAPTWTLDYDAEQIADLQPLDDDQATANDVTVTRTGGTSVRLVEDTGPLSVQQPPDGVGPYPKTFPLSLFLDAQAADQAGYRLARGTLDRPRWPSLTLDLSKAENATEAAAATELEIGATIRLTDLPAWFPPGPYDLIVEGIDERVDATRWLVTLNLSPADLYRTAVLDTDDADGRALFRLGDDGNLTLNEDVDTTATSVEVAVGDGAPLTTTDVPLRVEVGGEVWTVTAVSGTSSPQTLTATRSANGIVKSHATGDPVRVIDVARLGLYG